MKNIYFSILTAGFIVAGGGVKLHAAPSDDVFLKSVPKVAHVVDAKRKEACDQVLHMNKHVDAMTKMGQAVNPRHTQSHEAWKQACDRRTQFYNTLVNGNDMSKLAVLKQIYSDNDVKKVIDEIDQKMQKHANTLHNPLDGAL